MLPSAPGLSVCCLTADRPASVAAIMATLRDVADELVAAVDSRVDPTTLGPRLHVVDTVVRFEYRDPPERARPWLVGLCRHPNVLMIDGDEVPSAALLDALPDLCADATVRQVRIARRWCFPDERTWLAERPWWPDFQRRLLRPPVDFDLGFHGGVLPVSPNRCVEEAIYHLVPVMRDYAVRRVRARQYEIARPGMVAVGGGVMNTVLYEPERHAMRRLAYVPADDMAALRSVLHAPDGVAVTGAAIPVVGADEVAAAIPADPVDAQGYLAQVSIVERDLRTEPSLDTHVLVEVRNTGRMPLPSTDAPGVELRVAARVVDRRRAGETPHWWFSPLPCDIPPGEARLLDAVVEGPPEGGPRELEVGLVNVRGRWFDHVARVTMDVSGRWGRFAP